MSEIAQEIAKYFKPAEVGVHDPVFKLFSIGSLVICLAGSLLCAGSQYFGDPIVCEFEDGIGGDFAAQHCWVHGSNWIQPKYQQDFDCRQRTADTKGEAEARTTYYQWVVFFLLIQAAVFLVPYKLWMWSEKGVVAGFVNGEVKSAFILRDDEALQKQLDGHVALFNSIRHHNKRYLIVFLLCAGFNFMFLIASFYVTDSFLLGKFANYGFDVWRYRRLDPEHRLNAPNPMCEVFPTKVSCNIITIGPGGTPNQHNGLCILAQNIVNEKVFLVLYFWYILLFVLGAFYVFYWAAVLLMPGLRENELRWKIRGSIDDGVLHCVMRKCYLSDWFVLAQVGKNVNPYFFKCFLEELDKEFVGLRKHRGKETAPTAPAAAVNHHEKDADLECGESVPLNKMK